MLVSFTINDQTKNKAMLERLERAIAASPVEIVNALCDVAIKKLAETTPTGKTGRLKAGWHKDVTRSGTQTIGIVSNEAEITSTGKMILHVLESGAHYRMRRIFPVVKQCLHFFWEKLGITIFARSVRTVDRRGHHMVKKTIAFLDNSYRQIAEAILARRGKP